MEGGHIKSRIIYLNSMKTLTNKYVIGGKDTTYEIVNEDGLRVGHIDFKKMQSIKAKLVKYDDENQIGNADILLEMGWIKNFDLIGIGYSASDFLEGLRKYGPHQAHVDLIVTPPIDTL